MTMPLPNYNDAIAAIAAHLQSGHAIGEVLGDLERTLEQEGSDGQLVAKVRAAHREQRPANTSMADDQQMADLPPTAE
jgi:hypothetical protein